MEQQQPSVDPHETLFVTARKRFVPVYGQGENGGRELVLHVGMQLITFDEPELFPWAEKLIDQDSFMAGSATTWANEPLEWPRVQGLLEGLLEAGLLARTPPHNSISQVALSPRHLEFIEAEKSRPKVDGPRSWNPDPGAVLRELVGRDLPLGYIETAMPIHRLVHATIDREGRQVGEANVFPYKLRLDIPIEWKTCGYAGSRYRNERPMNMTALRSMITHWKPVLHATLAFRQEFLRRFPQYPDGRWKLGDLVFVSSGILALSVFQVMRFRDPVANGDLDPVLSSLFRVTDGVRMVTAHMLDLYERPMFHDTPVTPRDLTDAAEREDQFRAEHGVCAGPQTMIDEFLATLMHGKPVEGTAPQPAWLADIPSALDYALRAIQLHSTLFTNWTRMGLAYTRIHQALERAPSPLQGRLGSFRDAVERDWRQMLPGRNHLAEQRDFTEPYYRRLFNNAQTGIRGLAPEDRQDLTALLTPPPALLGERAKAAMGDLFASAEDPSAAGANAGILQEIAGHVVDYLRFERNALRTVTRVQHEINALLERPQPAEPLTGNHLAVFHALRRTLPGKGTFYLLETVRETLGIAVENSRDATTVSHGKSSLVLH